MVTAIYKLCHNTDLEDNDRAHDLAKVAINPSDTIQPDENPVSKPETALATLVSESTMQWTTTLQDDDIHVQLKMSPGRP